MCLITAVREVLSTQWLTTDSHSNSTINIVVLMLQTLGTTAHSKTKKTDHLPTEEHYKGTKMKCLSP